jgi:hypothetical protein
MIPFSREQFLGVFEAYNTAVWPAQFALAFAAITATYLSLRAKRRPEWQPLLLAGLWVWSGAVYHIRFFSEVNPAAIAFGAFFVLQAVAFVVAAFKQHIELRFEASLAGIAGAVIITYALAVYPLLGVLLGHVYPASPTFGAPCPLVIFTFGLLLWNARSTPWYVWVIPAGWAIVGLSAARSFGMVEDYGLPATALTTAVVLFVSRVHGPASRARLSWKVQRHAAG